MKSVMQRIAARASLAGVLAALVVAAPGAAAVYSRKVIDELTEFVKQFDAKGLAWLRVEPDGKLWSPISKNFTLSLAEKATLRVDLKNWRGRDFTADELRGFELKNLLGVWAMLSVVRAAGNNGKEYTNISTINPVPKSLKASLPEGHNKAQIFSLDEPDMVLFETFSDFLRAKIESSPEWKSRSYQKEQIASAKSGTSFDDMESDVPF